MTNDRRHSAGPFFPNFSDNTLSPFNQCINSGLPVFARDVNENNSKTYFACGYQYFCQQLYTNEKRYRNIYEVLQADTPTKIFFDFDSYNVTHHRHIEDAIMAFIKGVVVPEVQRRWSVEPKVHYLTACTTTKVSYHVIVDIFLKDIQHVASFIRDLPGPPECLDDSIYTKNRCFRLLHSYKFGKSKESSLRMLVEPDTPLLDTFVQARTDEHVYEYSNVRKDATKKSYGSSSVNDTVIDKFVKLFGEDVRVVSKKGSANFDYFIVCGMICPWSGRRHRGNHTFMTINKETMKGWFTCADPECPKAPYNDFRTLFLYV